MEVCHCRPEYIGQGVLLVPQLYIILLVERLLHRYGPSHIRLDAAAYYCCVQFYVLFSNGNPGAYSWWLQLQRHGGSTGDCVAAVSQLGAHWTKRPLFGSIRIESLRAEVFVEPWIPVVEMVRKMITTSGMSWGIYCKLQVIMEWMTVNLHSLLRFFLLCIAASCRWFQQSRNVQKVGPMLLVCLFS